MTQTGIELSNARYGAWIVNISQALSLHKESEDLSRFDEILAAGRKGHFLQTIISDKENTLTAQQVAAYGRACKMGQKKVHEAIGEFKTLGLIDPSVDLTEYRIFSKDKIRVLDAVYQIFLSEGHSTDLEFMSINLMEFMNIRPRSYSELERFLGALGKGNEADLKIILRVFSTYGLINQIEDGNGGSVYYSSLQYRSPEFKKNIGEAIKLVDQKTQEDIDKLISAIHKVAGLLKDSCGVGDDIIDLAANLGLVEIVTVNSVGHGVASADFILPPDANKDSLSDSLEDDIFHNAKLLLSSIRFGEQKSIASRGRIIDPYVLVDSLIKNNEVGPCTAIGEDYVVLETAGVIETSLATNKPGEQYYMSLRRREPASIVRDLLIKGFRIDRGGRNADAEIAFPTSFNPPEIYRALAGEKLNQATQEARRQLILELRTARHG